MAAVQLIRKGVVPMIGATLSRTKLIGGDGTVPKGASILLGDGWTQKGPNTFVFDVPPGAAFKPLQFQGLVIGGSYNLTFLASASASYGAMVFRPGELGLDTVINADGAYDVDFTAQETNGISRFLHTDVTGVTRVTIAGLKLVAV